MILIEDTRVMSSEFQCQMSNIQTRDRLHVVGFYKPTVRLMAEDTNERKSLHPGQEIVWHIILQKPQLCSFREPKPKFCFL